MNKKSRVIIVLSLVAVGLVFIIYQFSGVTPDDGSKLSKEDILRKNIEAKDIATLYQSHSTPSEIYGALSRLGSTHHDTGLKRALELARSDQSRIREGVAKSLGFYKESRATEALKTLLKDPDEAVRIQAITALSRNRSVERKKILDALNSRNDFSVRERIFLIQSMAKMENPSEVSKINGARFLVEVLNKKGKASQAQLDALRVVLHLNFKYPFITKAFRALKDRPGFEGYRKPIDQYLATNI